MDVSRTGASICSHTDAVLDMLKDFQQSTRQLHNICAHGKVCLRCRPCTAARRDVECSALTRATWGVLQVLRDSTMMGNVPALKRAMETVIYRIKSLLMEHRLMDAFEVGNLKNRSLDGKEVCVGVNAASVGSMPVSHPLAVVDRVVRSHLRCRCLMRTMTTTTTMRMTSEPGANALPWRYRNDIGSMNSRV